MRNWKIYFLHNRCDLILMREFKRKFWTSSWILCGSFWSNEEGSLSEIVIPHRTTWNPPWSSSASDESYPGIPPSHPRSHPAICLPHASRRFFSAQLKAAEERLQLSPWTPFALWRCGDHESHDDCCSWFPNRSTAGRVCPVRDHAPSRKHCNHHHTATICCMHIGGGALQMQRPGRWAGSIPWTGLQWLVSFFRW